MTRVDVIDEPCFVADSDAVLPDEKELRMGNDKFLTVSRANGKGPKPAAHPLFQFLHVHFPQSEPTHRAGQDPPRDRSATIYSFDICLQARENANMQVTLTKDLEKFITRKVRAGGYASPSEVVRDALRDFRAKDDPAELDSQELAKMLLPAVRGRHHPLTARHFRQLRLRARRKPARE